MLTLVLNAGDKVECAALGLDLLDSGRAAGGRVPVLVVALIAPYGGSCRYVQQIRGILGNFFTGL